MDTLCSILFSRRTQGVLFGLILAAAILRNRTMWIITAAIVGTACAGMAIVAAAGLRRCGRAWRDFPDTPEYDAYARRREDEPHSADDPDSEGSLPDWHVDWLPFWCKA